MRLQNYVSSVLGLVLFSGCQYDIGGEYDIFSKRRSELCCPTDIRQTHHFSWGEDAIVHGPCGPDREFYGLKPTHWRVWSTSGEQWRDAYFGPLTEAEGSVDEGSVLLETLPRPESEEVPEHPDFGGNEPDLSTEPEPIDVPSAMEESSRFEQGFDTLPAAIPEPIEQIRETPSRETPSRRAKHRAKLRTNNGLAGDDRTLDLPTMIQFVQDKSAPPSDERQTLDEKQGVMTVAYDAWPNDRDSRFRRSGTSTVPSKPYRKKRSSLRIVAYEQQAASDSSVSRSTLFRRE